MSCLTTSNFPWFGDLTFQVSKQYSSWQHQIFLLSPNTWKTKCCICFGPATSFIRGLLVILLYSSPVAYRTPSDPGDSPFAAIPLWTFIQLMRFSQKVYCDGLHSFPQCITFCQNSLLWCVCHGWSCMAWLIASLSYANPFTDAMNMNLGKLWVMVRDREAWCAESMGSQRTGHDWWLNNNNWLSVLCFSWGGSHL